MLKLKFLSISFFFSLWCSVSEQSNNINWPAFLSQHDIVYNRLPENYFGLE